MSVRKLNTYLNGISQSETNDCWSLSDSKQRRLGDGNNRKNGHQEIDCDCETVQSLRYPELSEVIRLKCSRVNVDQVLEPFQDDKGKKT